ncbi:hypothetical protein D1821_06070 [Phaeobacter inhibens]|uniref:hypothetical protein n=1 Tax=Phaeobacter inhibens TaxID=221822 RepID=UPI0005C5DE0D|nr:hypothetical protein [Phaeobacter inhibens]AXT41987.1 hypothetical protein D1821_06070 [Phaeobacter inhibens]
MIYIDKLLTDEEVKIRRERRLEAMQLQEIEGNPLTPEEVEMFEMFERERWLDERCHEHLMTRAREIAANQTNTAP